MRGRANGPHVLRGLEDVEREAQQRGGVVCIGLCHSRADHEPEGASIQLVDLQQRWQQRRQQRRQCRRGKGQCSERLRLSSSLPAAGPSCALHCQATAWERRWSKEKRRKACCQAFRRLNGIRVFARLPAGSKRHTRGCAAHPVLLCNAVEHQVEAVQPAELLVGRQGQQAALVADPAGSGSGAVACGRRYARARWHPCGCCGRDHAGSERPGSDSHAPCGATLAAQRGGGAQPGPAGASSGGQCWRRGKGRGRRGKAGHTHLASSTLQPACSSSYCRRAVHKWAAGVSGRGGALRQAATGTIKQQRRPTSLSGLAKPSESPALPVRPPSRPDEACDQCGTRALTIGLRALPVADSELCMAASAAPQTPAGAGGPNRASNPPRQ